MNRMPELDYCRIDRASKTLKCDVEDIIHWAANGKIQISLMLNESIGSFYSMHDLNEANKLFISLNAKSDGSKYASKYSFIENEFNAVEDDLQGFFFYREKDEKDNFLASVGIGAASGLWKLLDEVPRQLEMYGFYYGPLMLLPCESEEGSAIGAFIVDNGKSFRITKNDLWLTKSQIKKIELNDLEMVRNSHEFKAQTLNLNKISHAVGERHAKRREVILIAAIYCKEKYPNECSTSIRAWAKCIEQRAMHILNRLDKDPLSLDRIERILGKAIGGKMIVE
ncbi:hypothetical protein SNN58_003511 [Cronobacter dublinensis]|nr:hypothetical protein [Cronobacter dublinensis]ELY3973348.1 hypothetical protein [Cronobacter dublinensis]ELY4487770.1 hypothetical protein [Cronobacter dublinensis]ELY5824940.1 hypothetical protein [Cronobacter dublinensis]